MESQAGYWKNPLIDLGMIKAGATKQLRFEALPTIEIVKSIDAACGCTKVKYYPEAREMQVTFRAGKFPNQVAGEYQKIHKTITITYFSGKVDVLTIKGIKKR